MTYNEFAMKLRLSAFHHRRSWHGLTTPLFSNFLFTNLFSITFLYFFIISSLFPYFNLFVSIFIQSYVNIKLHVSTLVQGRIQDFKLGGAHLKKLRRAEGGAKIFGVFRVKNHDFTPKNHIFPILGGAREIFGVFHVKNHDFTPKKILFLPILGGGGGAPPPPLNPPLLVDY